MTVSRTAAVVVGTMVQDALLARMFLVPPRETCNRAFMQLYPRCRDTLGVPLVWTSVPFQIVSYTSAPVPQHSH